MVHDLVDVASVFNATLGGVAAATRHDEAWPPAVDFGYPERRRSLIYPAEDLPPNRGAKWTDEDLARLVERRREGATVKELMAEFGRTDGGIRSRLQLLGESLSTQPARVGQAEDADDGEWTGAAEGAGRVDLMESVA